MTPAELEKKLGDYCVKANNAERDAVDKQEQFEILKDAKDAYFAKIVESKEGKSGAEKERKALASDEWAEWMQGFARAREEVAKAKMERSVYVRLWETCRSLLSSKRIERTTGI